MTCPFKVGARVRSKEKPWLHGVVVDHDHEEGDARGGLVAVLGDGFEWPFNAAPCEWDWELDADGAPVEGET